MISLWRVYHQYKGLVKYNAGIGPSVSYFLVMTWIVQAIYFVGFALFFSFMFDNWIVFSIPWIRLAFIIISYTLFVYVLSLFVYDSQTLAITYPAIILTLIAISSKIYVKLIHIMPQIIIHLSAGLSPFHYLYILFNKYT